jgi:hypothetical protein
MPKLKTIAKELVLMIVVGISICGPLYFAAMEVLKWK